MAPLGGSSPHTGLDTAPRRAQPLSEHPSFWSSAAWGRLLPCCWQHHRLPLTERLLCARLAERSQTPRHSSAPLRALEPATFTQVRKRGLVGQASPCRPRLMSSSAASRGHTGLIPKPKRLPTRLHHRNMGLLSTVLTHVAFIVSHTESACIYTCVHIQPCARSTVMSHHIPHCSWHLPAPGPRSGHCVGAGPSGVFT